MVNQILPLNYEQGNNPPCKQPKLEFIGITSNFFILTNKNKKLSEGLQTSLIENKMNIQKKKYWNQIKIYCLRIQ